MSQQPYYAAEVYGRGNNIHQPHEEHHQQTHHNLSPVASVQGENTSYNAADVSTNTQVRPQKGMWSKGEVQPAKFNDVLFSLIFFGHLGAMTILAGIFVPAMYNDMSDLAQDAIAFYDDNDMNYNNDDGDNDNDGADEDDAGGERMLQNMIKNINTDITNISSIIGTVPPFILNFLMKKISELATNPTHANTDIRRIIQEANDDTYIENQYNNNDGVEIDVHEILFIVTVAGCVGFAVAGLALPVLINHPKGLIKFALLFNVGAAALTATSGFLLDANPVALAGTVSTVLAAWFVCNVWGRIPFAASNLRTAVTSVRSNFGLALYAYSSVVILLGWSVWWALTTVATLYVTNNCHGLECETEQKISTGIVFLFLLSFFWTHQVVKNIIHVTVAGTVGTWWFTPLEASTCCSSAVRYSFWRSVSYSFGSICMGSLGVAIVQALNAMTRQAREQGATSDLLGCLVECLLGCIESIAEYFNQWAFVFVGVYGYSFMDAGYNVVNLFKTRGWQSIVTDSLISNVLFMVSLGVGFITGVIAVIVAFVYQLHLGGVGPFVIGAGLGFVLSSVIMDVVGSAVNTVIVLFAEAPQEFQLNHPNLSSNMRDSWRQAYPVEFQY